MSKKWTIFWFRRDLRLSDNAGLYHALKRHEAVLPLFIFDKNILDELPPADARVGFIHDTLVDLKQQLNDLGSDLLVYYGKPTEVWPTILKDYPVEAVYTNHDDEPYTKERDTAIKGLLEPASIPFHSFKDHVIFERDEVVKSDGSPYTVFTPYSRVWLKKLDSRQAVGDGTGSYYLQSYPTEKYFSAFGREANVPSMPTLADMGFQAASIAIPPTAVKQSLIKQYDQQRNFPAVEGTSRLGIHFRFGTISIREKARKARQLNATFLNELIWRDFYAMILSHFPHVVTEPFRSKYNKLEWRNNEHEFEVWCRGMTGYPMVDAGMRQLNATGYMHNRVRMVVASFLTKHLLVDWRWGEAYFAQKLLDFDLASNNGGWQWAAGCGTDAAPYFRIFNPASQQKKFDPKNEYIARWIPEWGTDQYPTPIVEHKFARERCLNTYKMALQ